MAAVLLASLRSCVVERKLRSGLNRRNPSVQEPAERSQPLSPGAGVNLCCQYRSVLHMRCATNWTHTARLH
eukprot:3417576-Rhodomonas_salina.1